MTEAGHVLVNRETGARYRVCGCLQVFPDEEAALGHRKVFTSGDPEEWEAAPVEVVDCGEVDWRLLKPDYDDDERALHAGLLKEDPNG